MKTPTDYLNDLKEKYGSDYETAKRLGARQTTISMIRKRGQMSDETAVKLAELLKIDADELLISAAIARSEGATKTAWLDHAKKAGLAASLALLINSPSEFVEASGQVYRLPNMYIMLNFGRWIFNYLFSIEEGKNGRKEARQKAKINFLSCSVA